MSDESMRIARDRVMELADDPVYRPYVIGYLLSCLNERHWLALVESALMYVEGVAAAQAAAGARAAEVYGERG